MSEQPSQQASSRGLTAAVIVLPILAVIGSLLSGIVIGWPIAIAGAVASIIMLPRRTALAVVGLVLTFIALIAPVLVSLLFGD